MRRCDCRGWKADIDKVNLMKETFLFCPWCNSRLIAPCYICDEPSNYKTGKTIYWKDDMNFCSPACTMKLEL